MNAIETHGLTRTYGRSDAVHGLTLAGAPRALSRVL